MKTTINITGMHCAACKMLIESVCNDIPGIQSCNVDYNAGIATIDHTDQLDWNILKKEIEELGTYSVSIQS